MEEKDLLENLNQVQDVNAHYQFIADTAMRTPGRLVPLFRQLLGISPTLQQTLQTKAVFERILEAVSLTPGVAQVSAALELYTLLGEDRLKKRMASQLASAQSVEVLLSALLERQGTLDDYIVGLITHELVVRGCDLRPHATAYHMLEAVNQRSIFRGLPLYPLAMEAGIELRHYTIGSSGNGIIFGAQDVEFVEFVDDSPAIPHVQEHDEITLPVHNWVAQSNGAAIGLKGVLPDARQPQEVLAGLDFGDSKPRKYKLRSITPSMAFHQLFGACANGGAYSGGEYGAVGRLYAFRSMQALTSAGDFDSAEATEQIVQRFDWYEFGLNVWFINEWLDIGILAMEKDGRAFGLLAGTDTD